MLRLTTYELVEHLLAALHVDDAAGVSIAHTMGVSSDPASETIARRACRRPTYAALAANVRLHVSSEEAELLHAQGARQHVVPPPVPPSSPHRRPRRPPENERR